MRKLADYADRNKIFLRFVVVGDARMIKNCAEWLWKTAILGQPLRAK